MNFKNEKFDNLKRDDSAFERKDMNMEYYNKNLKDNEKCEDKKDEKCDQKDSFNKKDEKCDQKDFKKNDFIKKGERNDKL